MKTKMSDDELRMRITGYETQIASLRSRIQLNKDGPAKQMRRIKQLAAIVPKLEPAIEEMQRRNDKHWALR